MPNTRNSPDSDSDDSDDTRQSKLQKTNDGGTNNTATTDTNNSNYITPEKSGNSTSTFYVIISKGSKPDILESKEDFDAFCEEYGALITSTTAFATKEEAEQYADNYDATIQESESELDETTTTEQLKPKVADSATTKYLQKVAKHSNSTAFVANIFKDKFSKKVVVMLRFVKNPDGTDYWCHMNDVADKCLSDFAEFFDLTTLNYNHDYDDMVKEAFTNLHNSRMKNPTGGPDEIWKDHYILRPKDEKTGKKTGPGEKVEKVKRCMITVISPEDKSDDNIKNIVTEFINAVQEIVVKDAYKTAYGNSCSPDKWGAMKGKRGPYWNALANASLTVNHHQKLPEHFIEQDLTRMLRLKRGTANAKDL